MLNVDGSFTYTPPDNVVGIDTIYYVVSDGWEQSGGYATITVAAAADLSIALDDDVDFAQGGGMVEYTIVVHNEGPSNAVGATVEDLLPFNLVNATWACNAGAGASCTSVGIGNINDTVTIPSGVSLVYLLSASVVANPEAPIVNTATVVAPLTLPDANAANNGQTDVDAVGIFSVGYDH